MLLYKQEHALIVPESEWRNPLKLSFYLTLEVLSNIGTLDELSLQLFREGPFGHFLDMKMKRVPIQLISHLIRRQGMTTKQNILAFNIE